MNMFDPKHQQGTYRAMQKPQYVLITENGKERTSHVTDARIMKAAYEIEANGYVTIEKCTPVRLVREAEYFAISFYVDSRVAVYFRVRKTVLRMDDLWDSIKGKVLNALGVAYVFGRGTDEDIELGYQYFEDAAKLDSEEAKKHLQYINSSEYGSDERVKN